MTEGHRNKHMTLRDLKSNFFLRLGIPSDRRVGLNRLRNLIGRLRPRQTKGGLIRIGPDGDGGYLVPDDLEGLTAALSPGVADECRFDLALAERGIPVFMADASVDGPPAQHNLFHFQKKFIEPYESENTTTFAAFSRFVESQSRPGDWLMQMDIEGAEWRVLLNAPDEDLSRCRILLIEFHHLQRLFSASNFEFMASVFERLLKSYDVVHIHPNNASRVATLGDIEIPTVMEFTFLRRDRFAAGHPIGVAVYPHPHDSECVPTRPPLPLPKIWR